MEKRVKDLVEKEIEGCFEYFWNESNGDKNSKGYGLMLDSSRNDRMCSVAATGFALSALVIGAERGYRSKEEIAERAFGTIKTVHENVKHENGFYYHFIDYNTAEPWGNTEFSTIDTALFLMGAVTVGEYFGGEIKEYVKQITEAVQWDWLVFEYNGVPCYHMSYNPSRIETSPAKNGWGLAKWGGYAEQLMMYILHAGQSHSDKQQVKDLYLGFDRLLGSYEGENFVYSFGNALFIHQFSQAYFDFNEYLDSKGFNWFKNSIAASLANRAWCENQTKFKGLHKNSWGLTAMHDSKGYRVVGGPPWGNARKEFDQMEYELLNGKYEGTVAPYGPLSSFPFVPKEAGEFLIHLADNYPSMFGKYGIYDSYSDEEELWISETYIGIDKGPTIVMLENYLNGTIWKYFMQSDVAMTAIEKLDFKKRIK